MQKSELSSHIEDCTTSVLCVVAFAVAFVGWMAPIPVFLLTFCCLVLTFQEYRLQKLGAVNPSAAVMLLFFSYLLICDFINDVPIATIRRMEFQIRLPLLLFSVALLFKHNRLDVDKALKFYVIGSYSAVILVFVTFVIKLWLDYPSVQYSFYHIRQCVASVFSAVSHRTYINFNLLIALIFVYRWYGKKQEKRRRSVFLVLALLTGLFIFISEARTSLLSYVVLLSIIVILQIKQYLRPCQIVLLFLLCLAGVVALLGMNSRITNLVYSFIQGDASLSNLDPRFQIWSCLYDIIHQGLPIEGLGAGNLQPQLQSCYENSHFKYGETFQLGVHNQFVEFLAEYGYIGLFLFVVSVLALFFDTKKECKYVVLCFVVVFLNLCFESMLSRSIGSYSLAFLLTILGSRGSTESREEFPSNHKIGIIVALTVVVGIIAFLSCRNIVQSTEAKRLAIVENLPGEPPASIAHQQAMRVDSTTHAEYWGEVAFMNYYFNELTMTEKDTAHFSLYVYVDEAFDGSLVRIKLDERNTNLFECYYDMTKKGTWQKLSLCQSNLTGSVTACISIDKTPDKDFSHLKGYLLFCDPKIWK